MRSDSPDHQHRRPTAVPETGCDQVTELLPWWSKGSLQEAERIGVDRHLEICETCRIELRETLEAAWLFSQHVPVVALIDHASGLLEDSEEQALVDLHLESCETCRAEYQTVAADLHDEEAEVATVTSIDQARASRRPTAVPDQPVSRWSTRLRGLEWLAAAACLALAILWTSTDRPQVAQQPEAAASQEQLAAEQELRKNEIFSLELTTAGAVPLMADGRAVLDGIFLDGFESPELLKWSDVSGGEEQNSERSNSKPDVSKPLTPTSKET